MTEALVVFDNVAKRFGDFAAVRGIEPEIAEGVGLEVRTSRHVPERFGLRSTEAMFAPWSPEHARILPGDRDGRAGFPPGRADCRMRG